jgi:hypothetical protein
MGGKSTQPYKPRDVLAAQAEIGRLGLDATSWAICGLLQAHQANAISACLDTAKSLRSLAPASAALAADRLDQDPNYGDAWTRQWSSRYPPTDDDMAMNEAALWFLAVTLRQLRRTLEKDSAGGWMATGDELKTIAASQRLATKAIAAVSMEAVVETNRARRENLAAERPTRGPQLVPARLAKVVSISA